MTTFFSFAFENFGRRLTFALFFIFLNAPYSDVAQGAVELDGFRSSPGSGIAISVKAFFDFPPLKGFDSLLIEIQNSTPNPQTWTLQSSSSVGLERRRAERFFEMELSVDSGAARSFEVMIPLCSAEDGAGRGNGATITLLGPGLGAKVHGARFVKFNERGAVNAAVSNGIVLRSQGAMEGRPGDKKNLGLLTAGFNPNLLPSDWRAFGGFDLVFIADADWTKMLPGPKKALFEWIAQGGELFVASLSIDSLFERMRLPGSLSSAGAENPSQRLYGLGVVHGVLWDGSELDADSIFSAFSPAGEDLSGELSEWSMGKKFNVGDSLGKIRGILLFIYAILVGPVNLYVLCKRTVLPGAFWTTAIMCAALSVAAPLFIVLWHGYGAEGHRSAVVMFRPDANDAVLMQEQIVKSGILLRNRGFQSNSPLLIKELSGGRKKSGGGRVRMQRGEGYSGDWFSDRDVDAYFIESVKPTRARVEVLGAAKDGRLDVVSSVDADLDEVFLVDETGRFWRGSGIRVGERASLTPSSHGEFNAFWAKRQDLLTVPRRKLLARQWGRPGFFFAWTKEKSGYPVETMESIQWLTDVGFLFGPYVVRG